MTDNFKIETDQLREVFYRAFDRGRMTDAFSRLAMGRSLTGFEEIGGGMHFKCWRDRKSVGGMNLVVKVSTPELLAELGNQDLWVNSLSRLGTDIPLIPPFEIIPLQTGAIPQLGMVMPYGEGAADTNSPQPRALEAKLAEFYSRIEKVGMELGDIPQIREWQKIPFIADLSDLRLRQGAV